MVFEVRPRVDEIEYSALLTGLATAGGYEPPPISVIRDIDLYRLLRAADAHLGMHSTVLTDAVVVGTPNLIATVDAHTRTSSAISRPTSPGPSTTRQSCWGRLTTRGHRIR